MKEVIVLGVARSGTSMTTAIIDSLGVNMNGSKEGEKGCPKGNYEDAYITGISSKVVNRVVTKEEGKEALKKHFEKRRETGKDWGAKATLLHFIPELFIDNLQNIHFVVVFRNPVDNAKSLVNNIKRRHQVDVSFENQFGSVLRQYKKISEVLEEFRDIPRLYTTYGLIKSNCLIEAERIADFLGLKLDQEKADKICEIILPDYTTIG